MNFYLCSPLKFRMKSEWFLPQITKQSSRINHLLYLDTPTDIFLKTTFCVSHRLFSYFLKVSLVYIKIERIGWTDRFEFDNLWVTLAEPWLYEINNIIWVPKLIVFAKRGQIKDFGKEMRWCNLRDRIYTLDSQPGYFWLFFNCLCFI